MTAVAAGELSIDTTDPGEPSGARTTFLHSATGAVTSVAPFAILEFKGLFTEDAGEIDAEDGAPTEAVGPLFLVDPPDDAAGAATTDLVLSFNAALAEGLTEVPSLTTAEFVQLVTFMAGSRNESGLVLVVDWADVVSPLEPGLPPTRLSVAGVDGVDPLPEVQTYTDAIDASTPDPALTQSTEPPLDFRVVTIAHAFDESFIPVNPRINKLPTTLTLFNNPHINLFDQFAAAEGGAEGAEASFRDLNSNAVAFEASIRQVETGFSLPLPGAAPRPPIVPEMPISFDPPTSVQERSFADVDRAVTQSGVEVILYGRVVETENGKMVFDEAGGWPLEWKDADGDYLRDIREQIDQGPSAEGRYRIVVETSRGEQPLEEWVKGDRAEEAAAQGAENGPIEENAAPAEGEEAAVPVRHGAAPHQAAVQDPPPAAPVGGVIGPVAGAAVSLAAWRRRFSRGERLEFDQDGVGFTRAARRRRGAER